MGSPRREGAGVMLAVVGQHAGEERGRLTVFFRRHDIKWGEKEDRSVSDEKTS